MAGEEASAGARRGWFASAACGQEGDPQALRVHCSVLLLCRAGLWLLSRHRVNGVGRGGGRAVLIRKILAPIKIKSALNTPPKYPPQNPKYPPPQNEEFMDVKVFLQKERRNSRRP